MSNRDEHPNNETLAAYRNRTLGAGELFAVGGHMAGCAECQERVREAGQLQAALSIASLDDARERSHLSYEQIEALVDTSLALIERRDLGGHLAVCASCRLQLDELKALKEELSVAAPERGSSERAPSGWWTTLRAGLLRPGVLFPASGLAAAGLASLVIFGLVVSPLRRDFESERLALRTQVQESGRREAQQRSELVRVQKESRGLQAKMGQLRDQIGTLRTEYKASAVAEARLASAEAELKKARSRAVDLQQELKARGTAAPPRDILAIRDGGATRVAAMPGHSVTLMGKAEAAAIQEGMLPLKADADLTRIASASKGGEATFHLETPVATSVLTLTPILRWAPLEGADRYAVSIRNLSTGQQAGASGRIRGTMWRVRPGVLHEDRRYRWDVTAYRGPDEIGRAPQRPALEGRFRVLPSDEQRALKQELAQAGVSRLARGLVFARAGLRDEAQHEFKLLAAENPGSDPLRKLVQSTRPKFVPVDNAKPRK